MFHTLRNAAEPGYPIQWDELPTAAFIQITIDCTVTPVAHVPISRVPTFAHLLSGRERYFYLRRRYLDGIMHLGTSQNSVIQSIGRNFLQSHPILKHTPSFLWWMKFSNEW